MADRNLVLQLLITAKDQASAALQGIRTGVGALGEAAARALEPLRTFGGLLTTALGIGGAKELQDRADAYVRLTNSLKIATSGETEYRAALDAVAGIASRTNTAIETTAQLYGKVAQSARELGLSQQQVGQLTEVISKGMQLSGASAETASGAILQLTQAFGSGTLRGEEFNSVMEASPELMRQLAAGLGVTIGELRGLAEQGALTSRAVSAALLSQKDAIDAAYGKTTRTVAEAFTNLNNQLILYVGKLNESTGATAAIGGTLRLLADNLNIVAAAAGAGLVTAMTRGAAAMGSYVKESLAAAQASRDAAIAAKAQQAAAVQTAQGNLAAAQAAVNRAVAEQRMAAILVEEAAGEAAVTRARATAAAAAQAATVATTRYMAAQEALNVAQATTATGAGLLTRAMGFLAGPGGLILLAVSAFGALLPLLSGNKTHLDALTGSTDQYKESLKALSNIQLKGKLVELNEAVSAQEGVVKDAAYQVGVYERALAGLTPGSVYAKDITDKLTLAQAQLADEQNKLVAITDRVKLAQEALNATGQQGVDESAKQIALYAQIQTSLNQYNQDLEQQAKHQKAVADAEQGRLQAELELARASGNWQAIEEKTIALAQSRATAAQQQAAADRDAATYADLKLRAVQQEYDLIREKQPKDEQALETAKQDAEAKKAQAAASATVAEQLTKQVGVIHTEISAGQLALKQKAEIIAAQEKQAQSALAVAQAELKLAEASGNKTRIAQAALEVAQQELVAAQKKREELQNELEQYRKIAERIQDLTARKDNLTAAEAAELAALKQKYPAIQEEIGAREKNIQAIDRQIEGYRNEAQQAAVMAGPVGELIRLYKDKAQAAQLQLNAVERYYSLQEKVIETEIAEAQAKNNTAQVIELKNKQVDLEVEKSQAMADATIMEANAQIELLNAKKINILASDENINAKQKEIAAIDDLIGKLQAQALAAQEVADKTKAQADSSKQAAQASEDVANSTKKIGDEAEKTTSKTEALQVAMIKFGEDVAYAFGAQGISHFNRLVEEVQSSINEANDAAERLGAEGLGAGVGNAESLAYSLKSVKGYLQDAANTAADNLLGALQSARSEAQGLAEDLASMANDFNREMLQIQGNQAALEALDYQDKLARLNELHNRAGQISDEEYNDALAKLNALHQMKLDKLREEEEERARNANAQNDSTNSTTGAMSGLADQAERAHRAISSMGATDLSGLYNQMETLGQAARGLAGAL